MLQAERSEQTILKNFFQRRARKLFGDDAEQGIVGVAIFVFRAGSEVGRTLERDGEHFLWGPGPGRVTLEALREFRCRSVVIQAAPHLEQLSDRDGVAIGNALDIFRDRVVEAQFSLLGQQHDHRGRHRLGVRGGAEMRIGPRRGRAPQLRRAVAISEIALRRAQENHGARQHELLGDSFHRGSQEQRGRAA